MMDSPTANAGLMQSLRRLVRGLSTLFWGMPFTLVVCVPGAGSEWFETLGFLPPVIATGMLFYGMREISCFHRNERPWRDAVEFTRLFAMVNLGLSPFVYLWRQMPNEPFFFQALVLLALSFFFFLATLNRSLQRLAAMLPDETLREETRMFTVLNLWLMASVLFLMLAYQVLLQLTGLNADPPKALVLMLNMLQETRGFLLLFLVLLPLSITMTMIWKIKEVVLAGVFSGPH